MNQANALQDEVECFLSLMRVSRMLLPRLKAVQAGKQKITLYYGALSHSVRFELGVAGDSF
jgi:hypothetical protein